MMITVHVYDNSIRGYAKANGYDIKSLPALRMAVKRHLAEFTDTAVAQAFEQAYQDGFVVDIHNVSVSEEYDEQDQEE